MEVNSAGIENSAALGPSAAQWPAAQRDRRAVGPRPRARALPMAHLAKNPFAGKTIKTMSLAICALSSHPYRFPLRGPHVQTPFPMRTSFHLAYHVRDLDQARAFYGAVLGCQEGRSTDTWVDFDFFGHQISLHLGEPFPVTNTGRVGDHLVPMPHLGLVMAMEDWEALAARLTARQMEFVLRPQIRFAGQPGEQATMFFLDPSGNPIEVKGFRDLGQVYAQ